MVSRMAAKRFTVDLQRVGTTGTSFRIPFDLTEAFGRARPPVKVTIRGHTWRTTPGVYDGVLIARINADVALTDFERCRNAELAHGGALRGGSGFAFGSA